MGLFKGPKFQCSCGRWRAPGWMHTSSCGGNTSQWKAPLPLILHISQAELGKGSGQPQRLLQAAYVLACGLSRHIFAPTFAIHQA